MKYLLAEKKIGTYFWGSNLTQKPLKSDSLNFVISFLGIIPKNIIGQLLRQVCKAVFIEVITIAKFKANEPIVSDKLNNVIWVIFYGHCCCTLIYWPKILILAQVEKHKS